MSWILARKTYENRRTSEKIMDFSKFLLVFAMFSHIFLTVFKDYRLSIFLLKRPTPRLVNPQGVTSIYVGLMQLQKTGKHKL